MTGPEADPTATAVWHEPAARLDRVLAELQLARSRSRAAELIAAGAVRVDGHAVLKPATKVQPGEVVAILREDEFVSRAAHKLVAALDLFGIDPAGRLALDLGASTGGFTQVLLARGASHVLAIDVGHDQMAPEIREDARVTLVEGCNARELTARSLAELTCVDDAPDLVVADLSFISLTLILPAIARVIGPETELALLIKPQFEVGRQGVKQGLVTDPGLWESAMRQVLRSATEHGLATRGLADSPVRGGIGNREFLVHLSPGSVENPTEWEERIRALAHGGGSAGAGVAP